MSGLKPVDNGDDDEDEECPDGTCEIVAEDAQNPQRVAFGVLNECAWVLYENGRVDVGTQEKVVTIPPNIMEVVAEEYEEEFM